MNNSMCVFCVSLESNIVEEDPEDNDEGAQGGEGCDRVPE